MKIKIIHIDDEKLARDSFRIIAESSEGIELIGQGASALEGIKLINNLKPDVVFIDINMPGGSGFEMIEAIDEIDFEIVFLTAYDKYAIKAIEKNAIAYLLKPIDIDELDKVIDKLQIKLSSVESKANPFTKKLFLSLTDGIEILDFDNIISIEASSNYSLFNLEKGKTILASKTLKEFEMKLPSNQFLRCHRSYIVNYKHITKYINKNGGYLELSNNTQIPLSDNKKDDFLSFFVEI